MLVAFDFDGTLADTLSIFRDAFDDAAREWNTSPFRRSEEEHIRTLEAVEVLRFHNVGTQMMERFVVSLRDGMERRHDRVQLFPNIPEALHELVKSGNALALLSSNSPALVRAALGELISLFAVQTFDVAMQNKAEKLREMSCMSEAANGLCYVGDEIRDLMAAKATQVPFAAVTWGYNTPGSLEKAGACTFLQDARDIGSYVHSLHQPGGSR